MFAQAMVIASLFYPESVHLSLRGSQKPFYLSLVETVLIQLQLFVSGLASSLEKANLWLMHILD